MRRCLQIEMPTMIVEERVYTLRPSRMHDFLRFYETKRLPLQSRILNMIGYFQT
jgi:hypothetical protein